MPLPKDMDKCMSKVKKEYPDGRSKKKKSKKAAHKQHVAMCLSAQEGHTMTFKEFLMEGTYDRDEELEPQLKKAVRKIRSVIGKGKTLGERGQFTMYFNDERDAVVDRLTKAFGEPEEYGIYQTWHTRDPHGQLPIRLSPKDARAKWVSVPYMGLSKYFD